MLRGARRYLWLALSRSHRRDGGDDRRTGTCDVGCGVVKMREQYCAYRDDNVTRSVSGANAPRHRNAKQFFSPRREHRFPHQACQPTRTGGHGMSGPVLRPVRIQEQNRTLVAARMIGFRRCIVQAISAPVARIGRRRRKPDQEPRRQREPKPDRAAPEKERSAMPPCTALHKASAFPQGLGARSLSRTSS